MLWAGNNENEAALIQDWYGTDADMAKYRQDYLNLYRNTIEMTYDVLMRAKCDTQTCAH